MRIDPFTENMPIPSNRLAAATRSALPSKDSSVGRIASRGALASEAGYAVDGIPRQDVLRAFVTAQQHETTRYEIFQKNETFRFGIKYGWRFCAVVTVLIITKGDMSAVTKLVAAARNILL